MINLPKKFLEAIRLFNLEEFYLTHDILEELWIQLDKKDLKRDLYQGILHIGVGMYHFTLRNSPDNKNHIKGCIKQLAKGVRRLETFRNNLSGKSIFIDNTKIKNLNFLEELVLDTKKWLAWLSEEENFENPPNYPKIHVPFYKI